MDDILLSFLKANWQMRYTGGSIEELPVEAKKDNEGRIILSIPWHDSHLKFELNPGCYNPDTSEIRTRYWTPENPEKWQEMIFKCDAKFKTLRGTPAHTFNRTSYILEEKPPEKN